MLTINIDNCINAINLFRLCAVRTSLLIHDWFRSHRWQSAANIDKLLPGYLCQTKAGISVGGGDGRLLGYLNTRYSLADLAYYLHVPLRYTAQGSPVIFLWASGDKPVATTEEYLARLEVLRLMTITPYKGFAEVELRTKLELVKGR